MRKPQRSKDWELGLTSWLSSAGTSDWRGPCRRLNMPKSGRGFARVSASTWLVRCLQPATPLSLLSDSRQKCRKSWRCRRSSHPSHSFASMLLYPKLANQMRCKQAPVLLFPSMPIPHAVMIFNVHPNVQYSYKSSQPLLLCKQAAPFL